VREPDGTDLQEALPVDAHALRAERKAGSLNLADQGKFLKYAFGPPPMAEGVFTHRFMPADDDEDRRLFEREYRRLLYNVDLIGGL